MTKDQERVEEIRGSMRLVDTFVSVTKLEKGLSESVNFLLSIYDKQDKGGYEMWAQKYEEGYGAFWDGLGKPYPNSIKILIFDKEEE